MLIKEKRHLFFLLGLSLSLFLIDSFGGLRPLHRLFEKKKRGWQGILFKKVEVKERGDEVERLKTQLASCQLKVLKLEEENAAARRLLESDLPPSLDFQAAHLLGRGRGYLKLDVGEEQGVLLQAPILADDVLIGRISRVSSNTSWVRLLTSRDSKEIVGIWRSREAAKKEKPLVKGILRGGDSLMIEEVLAHEQVEKGDLVASLSSPYYFLIGEVGQVWISSDGLYKRVLVKPFFDIDRVVTVFVVKG